VIKLAEANKGFVLLPKRWVIERSFAWAERFRRLAKDYERLPKVLRGLHFLVFAILMLPKAVPLLTNTGNALHALEILEMKLFRTNHLFLLVILAQTANLFVTPGVSSVWICDLNRAGRQAIVFFNTLFNASCACVTACISKTTRLFTSCGH
jgi:hypothetical protein